MKFKKAFFVEIKKRLGLSVSSRWVDLAEHSPAWDERTKILASHIAPGAKVIEFGAGRQALAKLLPPGCQYRPSDLVDRGNGTLVLDLNAKTLPHVEPYDCAVLGGVLEYIHDVPRLLAWLNTIAPQVVLSYAPLDLIGSLITRREKGWINDYTIAGLVEAMGRAGYKETARATWHQQVVLAFVRSQP
jgi:hypothetical protein